MELLSWVEEAAITYRLSISFRKVVSRGEIGKILFVLTSILLSNLILEFFSEIIRYWKTAKENLVYLNIRMIILEEKKMESLVKFGKINKKSTLQIINK